eukprot:TRINITY_DN11832_c0_g1_i4.p2 TRINITY_DN11832_c0_g1~~TRINITY_DN11832_c0_g1_i4.p2  ORF type:complete len:361 (-),score=52.22 TRINITY_DN11832_c0_g1_i4:64-1146(-)
MDRFRCPGVLGVTPGVVTRSVHRRSKSTASRQVANVTGTPLRGCDGTLPPQPSTVPTPSRLLKVSVVASQASVAEQPISAATSTTAAACTPPGDPPNDQLVLAAPGSALSLPVWSDRCYPKSNFDLQLPRGSIPRGGGQLNVRMRCHAAFCRVVQAELVRLEAWSLSSPTQALHSPVGLPDAMGFGGARSCNTDVGVCAGVGTAHDSARFRQCVARGLREILVGGLRTYSSASTSRPAPSTPRRRDRPCLSAAVPPPSPSASLPKRIGRLRAEGALQERPRLLERQLRQAQDRFDTWDHLAAQTNTFLLRGGEFSGGGFSEAVARLADVERCVEGICLHVKQVRDLLSSPCLGRNRRQAR